MLAKEKKSKKKMNTKTRKPQKALRVIKAPDTAEAFLRLHFSGSVIITPHLDQPDRSKSTFL